MTRTLPLKRGLLALGAAGVALAITAAVFTQQSLAAENVIVRGIVKPGGDANQINIYITHVQTSADNSRIRGIRTDVDLSKAKKFKMELKKNVLVKRRTTSNPTVEQEVVVWGTKLADNRIVAKMIVQNYRKFTIEGTVQGVTLDTGKTDEGYITVNVTSAKLLGVKPVRAFKEKDLKGKDLRIRVEGSTAITALGNSKNLDEVSSGQQKVRIEGELLQESNWTATKVNELNS